MSTQQTDNLKRRLTAFFGRSSAQRRAKLIRRRLGKRIDKGRIKLLAALFERMERYAQGVEADQFRIDFKDSRREIDRLAGGRLMTENYEPDKKVYRPTLIALPLVGGERALKTLALIDRVLVYFAVEFERERNRQITLRELSEALDTSLDDAADAMGYIVEGPASGGRSTGWPQGPDWYFIPGENALDFPDLDTVIAQHVEWLRHDRRILGAVTWWHRTRVHKIIAALVLVLGATASAIIYAGNIAGALSALAKLLGGAY